MASQLLADNHQSWSSAWGDFDNIGISAVAQFQQRFHKLMQNGDGTFTNITIGSSFDGLNGQSIEWNTRDFT